ncbi:MAG: hypothetical protein IPN26_05660 [Bacteroidetes bacterium]|nr:hypothetical protein [Bacteroidota bacterium]
MDFLISVQYHQILNERHIQKARTLAINLHMAPLPEYRGCNQFSFAILDQYPEFGTTLHVMDERIDHGDILFEKDSPYLPIVGSKICMNSPTKSRWNCFEKIFIEF